MQQSASQTLITCRYQVQYDVTDSNGKAATPLVLNITFVESAIVTGSFTFISQAAGDSNAQEIALALYNTSSVVNAAFTATVASVFQTWLADTTSAYVSQQTAGLESGAALVQAINAARLSLFVDVLQSDVRVLNSTVDQNITAQLVTNSTASVQSYAYNVTMQVTVLTANLLSSVFVDVLNSTSSRRHLLSAATPFRSDPLEPQHSIITAWLAGSKTRSNSSNMLSSMRMYNSNSSTVSSSSMPIPPTLYSSSSNTQGHSTSSMEAMGHVVRSRKLQATQSSSAFPLASLLMFKMDLTLAAFLGTSGCSTDNIAELFYDGADTPEVLEQLCGSSDNDFSLSQALLAVANSSIPLFQVSKMQLLHTASWPMTKLGCANG